MKTKTLKHNQNDWSVVSFGDVATLRKGLTYKSSDYSDKDNGMVFLTLKSILRGGGFNYAGIKYYLGRYDSEAVLKAGDLIIANTDLTRNAEVVGAPVFVPDLSDKPVLMSMDLSAIDVDESRINKLFFYYLLQDKRARDFMKNQASGSTVLHLKTSNVPKFEFQLPPLIEQKKIAEILRSVDGEIAKITEIILATEKLRSGITQCIFNDDKNNFEIKKLEEVAEFENGKAHENLIADDGKYVVVNSKFIAQDGEVFKKTNDGLKVLKRQDIAIVMSDIPQGKALAKCFLVDENDKYTLNQRIGLIRATKVSSKYLYYYLNRNKYFLDFSNDTSQTNLKKQQILDCPVLVPTKEKQDSISNTLDSINQKIVLSNKMKTKLIELKKGLMQDLLTGKVKTI